jgi:hypothetical protein
MNNKIISLQTQRALYTQRLRFLKWYEILEKQTIKCKEKLMEQIGLNV